jgi:Response regulator containing CheY-like receiver, AAA-type ATPase, and DNA-binding domains
MAQRILVVDDDKDVCDLVCLLLESEGYEVTSALGGKQALRYAQSSTPDLVITDVVMPEVDGFELLLALRTLCPAAKSVLMSGAGRLSPEQYMQTARWLIAGEVLRKPFTRAEFLATVQRALSTAASGGN